MKRYRTESATSFYAPDGDSSPSPGKRTLTMGASLRPPADDAVEQEADRAAARVVDGLGGGAIAAAPVEIRHKGGGGEVAATDAAAVDGARGGGAALPSPFATRMGAAFGADFADVRIHADSSLAADAGARAMTRGADVFFAPGEYDAASRGGQELIAHELTHVVQQRGGAPGLDFKLQAATAKKGGAGFHKEAGSDAVGKKVAEIQAGQQLLIDPDQMHGEFAYAEWNNQHGYVKLRKVDLTGDDGGDDSAFAARGFDATHASGQLEAEDEGDAARASGKQAVSRGRAGLAESKGEARTATRVLETAGAVTSLGTSKAIEKATDDDEDIKKYLPMSMRNKVKLRIGQVLNLLGSLPEAALPVVGGVIGAPLTAAGTALTSNAQGMSLGRSAAKGAATAGAGMATGAIPVVGQVDGAVSLASAADALSTPIKSPSKSETVENLTNLLAELDTEIAEASAQGVNLFKVASFARMYKQCEHYLAKYKKAIEAKEDAGERGLLKS